MIEKITLGGGCFWCIETLYKRVNGVTKVVSGYSGGHVKNPCYREVCEKTTGHIEVVQVHFDNEIISLKQILDMFWHLHDPTQVDGQGKDIGPQYMSAVFCENEAQLNIAIASKNEAENDKIWEKPFVTKIEMIKNFYVAEQEHDDYYDRVGDQNPYCTFVISPKVAKLQKLFKKDLK